MPDGLPSVRSKIGFTATASQTVSLAGNLLVPWYKSNTYWYYGTTVAAVLR